MRLGTSRTLFRRAKLRRVRGASTRGKTATPQGVESGTDGRGRARRAARPAKIAQRGRDPRRGRSALTDPAPAPAYVARECPRWSGCDYRPTAPSVAADSRRSAFVRAELSPFPGLVLDGRLRRGRRRGRARAERRWPTHALRCGASTGSHGHAAARTRRSLVCRACEVSTFAVELSALDERELAGPARLPGGRPRLPFHYLVVCTRRTKGLRLPEADARRAARVAAAARRRGRRAPRQRSCDLAAWRPLGHRRRAREHGRPQARRPAPLSSSRRSSPRCPSAGLCLDVAHAGAVDPTHGRSATRCSTRTAAGCATLHVSSLRRDARARHVPLTAPRRGALRAAAAPLPGRPVDPRGAARRRPGWRRSTGWPARDRRAARLALAGRARPRDRRSGSRPSRGGARRTSRVDRRRHGRR